ncbi:TolC family protein [Oceanithermus sp.]
MPKHAMEAWVEATYRQPGYVRRRRIWLGALLLFAAGSGAGAFGPEDVLAVEPSAYGWTLARMELASFQESTALWGVSGWIQADRNDDWRYRGGIGLNLDPVRRAQARLNLARTETQTRRLRRAAVYDALTLHARMWQAQADLEAARLAVAIAQLNLEATQLHGAGALELEDARLALEEARLGLAAAENRLEATRAEAELLGLSGPAEPRVLRFALPEPRRDRTPELEAELQSARRDRSWRGLFALRAAATYTGSGDFDYRFEVRTAEPRFDVSFGPKFPFSQAGEWRFSLSARFSLDPTIWAQTRQTELAALERRTSAQQDEARRALDLVFWRRQASLAEERLALASQRLELAQKRERQAERRLELGLVSPLAKEQAALARWQAESRLASAWSAYLRAVHGYLEAADQDWRKP